MKPKAILQEVELSYEIEGAGRKYAVCQRKQMFIHSFRQF